MPYEKQPYVHFAAGSGRALAHWDAIRRAVVGMEKAVVCVDCYPGADVTEIEREIAFAFEPAIVIRMADLMHDQASLDSSLKSFVTEDRVFGYMAPFQMADFFTADGLANARETILSARQAGKSALIVGVGAALVRTDDAYLVYADMPRWEIQKRMRAGMPNLTADNPNEDILTKYKRGFFIEWRVADRWKIARRLTDVPDLIAFEN